jgi:hypothetical protein
MSDTAGRPRVSYLCTWLSYPGWRGKVKLLRSKLIPTWFEYRIRRGGSFAAYLLFLITHPFVLVVKGLWTFMRDLLLLKKRKTSVRCQTLLRVKASDTFTGASSF